MSSKFGIYAIGTVTSDLVTGNAPINVMLHELMGNVDGEIGNTSKIAVNTKASDGKVYAVNMESSGTVSAIWLSNNSNRVTPPNVRKGEKVEIWKYADTDKYYWKTMTTEFDLRKLEHVKWVFVNTNAEGAEISDSNSYSFTVSPLNKIVSLHTSANDGECTEFDFIADTKQGVFMLKDGRGNIISLESYQDGWKVDVKNQVDIIAANTANIITKEANITADTLTIKTKKTSINA